VDHREAALAFLRALDAGSPDASVQLAALATAVLARDDVRLAARILAGEPYKFRRGVELAEIVLGQRAAAALPTPARTPQRGGR
jgi:hypothetical protein